MLKRSILISTVALGLVASPFIISEQLLPKEEKIEVQAQEVSSDIEAQEIQSNEAESQKEQQNLPEQMIVEETAKETAERFAEAVKMRDGAEQYALFTDALKAKVKEQMEKCNWVTGISSPWVESYKIISEKELENNQVEIIVQFELYTSTGLFGKDTARITLEKINDQWYINNITPADEESIGIWNTYGAIK